uniref:AMP-dependent synthetase/ligase domain-containing protein n=1 Tax=Anopheles melas TaxID=34690 RepID=A0A182UB21_9DIPT
MIMITNGQHVQVLQSIRTQSTDATGVAHEKAQSYVHHIGSKPLVYRNVGQHLRLAAERFPNNEAIVSCHEAGARLTYAAVLDKVSRLPTALDTYTHTHTDIGVDSLIKCPKCPAAPSVPSSESQLRSITPSDEDALLPLMYHKLSSSFFCE